MTAVLLKTSTAACDSFSTQPPTASTDDEQKSIYRRVLRGGDIPSAGLQKRFVNNRGRHARSLCLQYAGASRHQLHLKEKRRQRSEVSTALISYSPLAMTVASSSAQRPLVFRAQSASPLTKLFAYYSVHWEENQFIQCHQLVDHHVHFEINSCLYLQNPSQPIASPHDDGNQSESDREDGCGYVIIYPPHVRPTDNLEIYNFDRPKRFVLTSNDVYRHSKNRFASCRMRARRENGLR